MKQRYGGLLLAALLVSAAGCGGTEEVEVGDGETGDGTEVLETGTPMFGVYQMLRATGFQEVTVTGTIPEGVFPVEGKRFDVIGREMQMWEFDSKEETDAAAATIAPDGRTINGKPMNWKATPHFYRSDLVITLYLGDEPDMRAAVDRALGKQFAGG